MPNVVKREVYIGTGPSGKRYEWVVMSPMEHAVALGGVPGLSKMNVGKMDLELLTGNVEFNYRLLVRCVKYPTLVLPGSTDPDPAGDWGYVSDIEKIDFDWLVRMVGGERDASAASTAKEAL